MDIFHSHNYCSATPHERLPVVPDIDEEADDEYEDVFVNCNDESKTHCVGESLPAVGPCPKLEDIARADQNHMHAHVNDKQNKGDTINHVHKLEATMKFAISHQDAARGNPNCKIDMSTTSEKESESSQESSLHNTPITDQKDNMSQDSVTQKTQMGPNLSAAESPQSPIQTDEDTTALLSEGETSKHLDVSRHSSVNSGTSFAGSLDDLSEASSIPDFGILKSAMKRSCEESKTGQRRLSLFNQVMRRVSIHRRESTPTGRIATFLFGVEDPAGQKKQGSDKGDALEQKDVDENGGHVTANGKDKRDTHVSQLRESLFLILSGLYGIIVVILGAVIPITEIFIVDSLHRAFEAFYVYLYVGSVLFLGYVYAYLLRRNRLNTEFLTRTLSRSVSWTRAWGKSLPRGTESYSKGKLRKRMISLDVSNHHTGTFYLRLGVLGFGIGSMIHSGLKFGTYFSLSGSACNEPLQAVKPMIHLVFTFFQLYFIFMNSKMCIHRYKKLARFGLMHMCATNICVWFRSIVVETLHVIHSQDHDTGHHEDVGHHSKANTPSPLGHRAQIGRQNDPAYLVYNTSINLGRKLNAATVMARVNESNTVVLDELCQWSDMMSKAVEAAGPYLYPCTIEYSLMCAGILYVMWKNVGKRPRRPRGSELGDDDDDQRVHRMSVDCTGSSRGLFLGILVMVGTIISIIAFYMLNNRDDSKLSGIILTHMSETVIYIVTLIALFLAAYRMKSLTFHSQHEADLEDILILISYTGLLLFIIFSLVASILSKPDTTSGLTILSNIVMLIQATVQTIFMLAGDRVSASTESQERKKPGREFITFLLISNFAMWAINTFETQTPQHNPVQVDFYGPEAWAIFTHISVPLGIYYRFHSTVCFSNIWKNAWKMRKH